MNNRVESMNVPEIVTNHPEFEDTRPDNQSEEDSSEDPSKAPNFEKVH